MLGLLGHSVLNGWVGVVGLSCSEGVRVERDQPLPSIQCQAAIQGNVDP